MSLLDRARSAGKVLRERGPRGFVRALFSRLHLPVAGRGRLLWSAGTHEETEFWDQWLRTKGGQWPHVYRERCDPGLLLQPGVAQLLPAQPHVRILDVGAGPLTSLGKTLPGREIEITAIDARADVWDGLLEKYGARPLVRTQKLAAEELATRFAPDTFDLVYARNSIDHCYDPERAVVQMIGVVKRGCFVLLEHARNEGEYYGWRGSHQYDLSMSPDGDFTIASRHSLVNMTRKYSHLCAIECRLIEGERAWLITKIRKR